VYGKLRVILLFGLFFGWACVWSEEGVLIVSSSPDSAEISLNSIRTGAYTPDTLHLDTGEYYVTVLMKDAYFRSRKTTLGENDTVQMSFSRIPIFDTLAVKGTEYFGILSLPSPPVDLPYLIDGTMKRADTAIILPEGTYDIHWDGGIGYYPVDTVVQIRAGQRHRLSFSFDKRYGRISLVTQPREAKIFLNDSLFGVGETIRPLTAGTHELRFEAEGYEDTIQQIVLFPGRFTKDTVELEPKPIPEDVDLEEFCAQFDGIYPGCPQVNRWQEARNVGAYVWDRIWDNSLSVEICAASFSRKQIYNDSLRSFISLYNDGSPLFNNYSGLHTLNKIWIGYRGGIVSLDWGQAFHGLQYEKNYNLPYFPDTAYEVIHDEFRDRNSAVYIRSFSLQGGFQLRAEDDILSFSFMGGYVWETFEFTNLSERDSDAERLFTFIKDNNHSIVSARAVAHPSPKPLRPAFYGEISMTPFDADFTGWVQTRLGVIIPWWL
jgi:hypothetical protein